jgi:hypothetical protein
VPDLLEAIIQPPGPVKEESQRNLMNMSPFGSKISKFKISTFWIPEIQFVPAEANASLFTSKF